MAKEKRVLVQFQDCYHPVTFMSAWESESDLDLLLKKIFKAFDDQLGKHTDIFLQIKDEEWLGSSWMSLQPKQSLIRVS